jgi:hypothetical protein
VVPRGLLERADGRKPSVIEETLLAEVLALRTILLNLHFMVAKGETITAEGMQAIIKRADAGKAKKAAERLEERMLRPTRFGPSWTLSRSSCRWSWQTADAERPDCAFVGSPGKLANSWQMGF